MGQQPEQQDFINRFHDFVGFGQWEGLTGGGKEGEGILDSSSSGFLDKGLPGWPCLPEFAAPLKGASPHLGSDGFSLPLALWLGEREGQLHSDLPEVPALSLWFPYTSHQL